MEQTIPEPTVMTVGLVLIQPFESVTVSVKVVVANNGTVVTDGKQLSGGAILPSGVQQ